MTQTKRIRRLKQRDAMAKLRKSRIRKRECPKCGGARGETLQCEVHAKADRERMAAKADARKGDV